MKREITYLPLWFWFFEAADEDENRREETQWQTANEWMQKVINCVQHVHVHAYTHVHICDVMWCDVVWFFCRIGPSPNREKKGKKTKGNKNRQNQKKPKKKTCNPRLHPKPTHIHVICDVYIYPKRIYTHTYIHTYIPTRPKIHIYPKHICTHTYINVVYACMYRCIHNYTNTYVCAYLI